MKSNSKGKHKVVYLYQTSASTGPETLDFNTKCKWSASTFGRVIPEETVPGVYQIGGWAGYPEPVPTQRLQRETFHPSRESNTCHPPRRVIKANSRKEEARNCFLTKIKDGENNGQNRNTKLARNPSNVEIFQNDGNK
jgi:hypothetical protein